MRIFLIATKCDECQEIIQYDIPDPLSRFAELLKYIYQGKLPLNFALMEKQLTKEQRRVLKEIRPCLHPESRRERTNCPSGGEGERCLDCGRLFRNPAWWVLEHKTDTEVNDDGA